MGGGELNYVIDDEFIYFHLVMSFIYRSDWFLIVIKFWETGI